MRTMLSINLTEQDKNNLIVFLERATMNGKEVAAYARIVKAIVEAKPTKEGGEKDNGNE